MHNNTPGDTETVRELFERLDQALPGWLGLRLQALQRGVKFR
jgi:hypothetical protein